mmetsp:Transcript_3332/g.9190  ORF Transcript_3332/g.9190 Transcript_3332/m.9190 type:complete len:237 (-) Transcript_3332:56-766(-)
MARVDLPALYARLVQAETMKSTMRIPRFGVSSTPTSFVEPLRVLGVSRAFGDDAEFPLVSEAPLHISKIVQRVVVEANEIGTEAAAATTVIVNRRAAVRHERTLCMRCDGPVGLSVVLSRSGLALFSGPLLHPAPAQIHAVGLDVCIVLQRATVNCLCAQLGMDPTCSQREHIWHSAESREEQDQTLAWAQSAQADASAITFLSCFQTILFPTRHWIALSRAFLHRNTFASAFTSL